MGAVQFLELHTTYPTRRQALAAARSLVKEHLAACCQVIGPGTSVYRWKGKVEEAREWYCVAKVRSDRFAHIVRHVATGHPYEVPEIVACPIVATSPAYAAWLSECLAPGDDPRPARRRSPRM